MIMNKEDTDQDSKTNNSKDKLKDIFLKPNFGIKGEPLGDDRNHKSFLGRTSLSTRRSLILLISFIAFSCLAILFIHGDRLLTSSFQKVRDTSDFSKLVFKIESEIIALKNDSNNFIWTKNLRYAKNYNERADTLIRKLEILTENPKFPTSQKLSTTLLEGITEHKKQFSKVIEIQTLLGFNKDIGILANANASLSTLEKRLLQLGVITKNASIQNLMGKLKVIEIKLTESKNLGGQKEILTIFNRLRGAFSGLPLSSKEKKIVGDLLQSHRNDVTQIFRTQNTYNQATNRLEEISAYIAPSVGTMINYNDNLSLLTSQESRESQRLIRQVISIGSATILIVMVLFFLIILISISRPETRISETAMELAHGNVSAPIPYLANSDAIGELSNALTIFRENMLQADRLRKDLEIVRQENLQPNIEQIPNAHNLDNVMKDQGKHSSENTLREETLIGADSSINSNTISNISNKITTTSQNASDAFEEVERTEIMVSGLEDTAEKIEDIEILMVNISDQVSLLAVQTALHTQNDTNDENLVHLYERRDKRKTKATSGSGQSVDDRIKSIQDGAKRVLKDIQSIGTTVNSVNEVAKEISNTISREALTAANQLLRQSEDLRTILDNILDKTQNENSSISKPKV